MAPPVENLMTFDVAKFGFSGMRKNTKGGKSVYMNVHGATSGRVFFRVPECRSPFGLGSYTDDKSGSTSYSLDISLDDPELIGKIRSIEDLVLNHVTANSDELLGKKYTTDVIRQALFKSCIKESKDGKYAPTLKLKVLSNNGTFDVGAYKYDKSPTTLDTLQKGQRVKTLIDFAQIWIIDNKFGISIRLKQVMMAPNSSLDECALGDDDDENNDMNMVVDGE
jgi:hypothetical protein